MYQRVVPTGKIGMVLFHPFLFYAEAALKRTLLYLVMCKITRLLFARQNTTSPVLNGDV